MAAAATSSEEVFDFTDINDFYKNYEKEIGTDDLLNDYDIDEFMTNYGNFGADKFNGSDKTFDLFKDFKSSIPEPEFEYVSVRDPRDIMEYNLSPEESREDLEKERRNERLREEYKRKLQEEINDYHVKNIFADDSWFMKGDEESPLVFIIEKIGSNGKQKSMRYIKDSKIYDVPNRIMIYAKYNKELTKSTHGRKPRFLDFRFYNDDTYTSTSRFICGIHVNTLAYLIRNETDSMYHTTIYKFRGDPSFPHSGATLIGETPKPKPTIINRMKRLLRFGGGSASGSTSRRTRKEKHSKKSQQKTQRQQKTKSSRK
jgi:hypothetical protein